jgi:hypothetical protein
VGSGGPAPTTLPGSGSVATSLESPGVSPSLGLPTSPTGDVTLVGAGDIASCGLDDDAATAALVDTIPGAVFTAGDNAYENGTRQEFSECFAPTWGAFKDRIRPAAGNHDWNTKDAAGYLGYFGDAATNPDGRTWYSYELGVWHVIVLDSNCAKVGGCEPDSDQGRWLALDLAASDRRCSIAIWHHPRFSSGEHRGVATSQPLWAAVVDAGVDLVINGHDHDYERFAPQETNGNAAPDGTREIVVGTGGAALRPFPGGFAPNSLVRSSIAYGVLQLTLQPNGYQWQFRSTDGSFSDQGSAACH